MVTVDKICNSDRCHGLVAILAIGTATPPNCINQTDYPDFYFRITNNNHMTHLKQKFKHICTHQISLIHFCFFHYISLMRSHLMFCSAEKSMIRKRYMHLSEEFLKQNPNMCTYMAPSLDLRQDIMAAEVPKLGKEAAVKAIQQWGQPKSKITHLVFYTSSGVDMPSSDYQLTKLLNLQPSVKRLMIYQQGCFAGGTNLRLAKDLSENNKCARVLVVCSEISVITFQCPNDTYLDSLVPQALFGDGAPVAIVCADPDPSLERQIFHLVSAAQTILKDSDGSISVHLQGSGLMIHLSKDVPSIIAKNIKESLVEALKLIGVVNDWNSIFWTVHPGGQAILDEVEMELGLKKGEARNDETHFERIRERNKRIVVVHI